MKIKYSNEAANLVGVFLAQMRPKVRIFIKKFTMRSVVPSEKYVNLSSILVEI